MNDIYIGIMKDFLLPVAQMALYSKQVLIETFNGCLLKDKVNTSPTIQHSHLEVSLLVLHC